MAERDLAAAVAAAAAAALSESDAVLDLSSKPRTVTPNVPNTPAAAAAAVAVAAVVAPSSAPPRATSRAPPAKRLPLNPLLASALREWRSARAAAEQRPASVYVTVELINALARRQPRSRAELRAVPGMDAARAERYGDALLALIEQHAAD
jgi:superfamily II DNA helicase RecQ